MNDTLDLDWKHMTFRVSDVVKAKEFYIDKLDLALLDERPGFFAAKAGSMRISFFGGYTTTDGPSEKYVGTQIIFSTADIEDTRNKLVAKEIELITDITNANNYLKFILIKDPDGTAISIAQYLIPDTLEKKL